MLLQQQLTAQHSPAAVCAFSLSHTYTYCTHKYLLFEPVLYLFWLYLFLLHTADGLLSIEPLHYSTYLIQVKWFSYISHCWILFPLFVPKDATSFSVINSNVFILAALTAWKPFLISYTHGDHFFIAFFFFAWQSAHQASLCKNCWFEFRAHLHRLGTPRDSQTNWATSMIGNLCVCVLSSTMNISGCLLENRKETFQTYRWMYLCNQRDSVWTIFVVFVYGPHLCKFGKKYFN